MATGDLTVFEEAKAYMLDGGWEAADDIKVTVITNGTVPAAGDTTPALADYTVVTNITAVSIGDWGTLISEATGTVTADSATNPNWAANGANGTNGYYALVYNDTQAGDPAIAFIELGGPINLAAAALTVTWNASGLFTVV